jgi:hypothetical protein
MRSPAASAFRNPGLAFWLPMDGAAWAGWLASSVCIAVQCIAVQCYTVQCGARGRTRDPRVAPWGALLPACGGPATSFRQRLRPTWKPSRRGRARLSSGRTPRVCAELIRKKAGTGLPMPGSVFMYPLGSLVVELGAARLSTLAAAGGTPPAADLRGADSWGPVRVNAVTEAWVELDGNFALEGSDGADVEVTLVELRKAAAA